jgi:hypothetical protein
MHGVTGQFNHVAIIIRFMADIEHLGVVKWPDNPEGCDKFALQWAGKSAPSAFRGLHQTCSIGVIDCFN